MLECKENKWYKLDNKEMLEFFASRFLNRQISLDKLLFELEQIQNNTKYDKEDFELDLAESLDFKDDYLFDDLSWCYENGSIYVNIFSLTKDHYYNHHMGALHFDFVVLDEDSYKKEYEEIVRDYEEWKDEYEYNKGLDSDGNPMKIPYYLEDYVYVDGHIVSHGVVDYYEYLGLMYEYVKVEIKNIYIA